MLNFNSTIGIFMIVLQLLCVVGCTWIVSLENKKKKVIQDSFMVTSPFGHVVQILQNNKLKFSLFVILIGLFFSCFFSVPLLVHSMLMTIDENIPHSTRNFPVGVAVNPKTHLIYVLNKHDPVFSHLFPVQVTVFNDTTYKPLDNVSLNAHCPAGIAVNPNSNLTYVLDSCSRSIYSVGDYIQNIARIGTGPDCRPYDLAINSSSNRIYVKDDCEKVRVLHGESLNTIPTNSTCAINSYDHLAMNSSIIQEADELLKPKKAFLIALDLNTVTNTIYAVGSKHIYVFDLHNNKTVQVMNFTQNLDFNCCKKN